MILVKQQYSGDGKQPIINTEKIEGSVIVRGPFAYVVEPDSDGPSADKTALVFDFNTGKWHDKSGEAWDEFEVRIENNAGSFK